MKKLYYSISEVAEMLEESVSTIRFWSNNFDKHLNPKRNGKGNRLYVEKDLDTLKRIKLLTREEGLSLEAVSRRLADNSSGDDKLLKIRESLLQIRARLVQIRETL